MMAKKLERIRKLLSLFILVTFFLETTVFAQVALVRSALPVRSVSTKPIYSPASSIPTVTTAPSTLSASTLPPAAATPAAPSTVVASSATQLTLPPIAIVRLSLSSDDEQGDRDSQAASSNADGRRVAFQSKASNLVPGDTNHKLDVFVRDELSGETFRVSVASDGTEANNDSEAPSISADGRYVAFESKASNLVAGDTRDKRDIHQRRRPLRVVRIESHESRSRPDQLEATDFRPRSRHR